MDLTQANIVELLPTAVRTSTATGTGVDIHGYAGTAQFILTSSVATAGTTPTLNVTLEHSDVVGSGYAAISGAAFTEITDGADATEMMELNLDGLKPFVRAVGTIAGTNTPTFGFGVVMVAVRQAGRNASQLV